MYMCVLGRGGVLAELNSKRVRKSIIADVNEGIPSVLLASVSKDFGSGPKL